MVLGVAISGLILLSLGVAIVFGVHRTRNLAEQQELISSEMFGARELFETLLSMESSQRGYLFTHDPSYLDPYIQNSQKLDAVTNSFERLVGHDDVNRDTAAEIRELSRTKTAELAETVALAKEGRWGDALTVVKGNVGQHAMTLLRGNLAFLIAQTRTERTALATEEARTFSLLYVLGGIVILMILVTVGVVIWVLLLSIAQLDAARTAEERNAMHDPLTGLPNRRYLSEWLTTAIAGASRAARELHVLYFDLDGFKAVNDRFGHEAGDRVLQATATRLRETLRSSDFVARLGGDEFVAALPDTGGTATIDALLARIEQQLSASLIPELKDGEVSASIGKARFPRDGNNVEALLMAADHAMYEIKEKWHAASHNKKVSIEIAASVN